MRHGELGYEGGKSILDDLLRELRPRYLTPRSLQRPPSARSTHGNAWFISPWSA